MEGAAKTQLKRSNRSMICLTSPRQQWFVQDANRLTVRQLITLEEARLSVDLVHQRAWFRRKISLSLSEILKALVDIRVVRKIELLKQIFNDERMNMLKRWTDLTIYEYVQLDPVYCQLNRQIQWLNQLEQMPIVMTLKSFNSYVNDVAEHNECFNLNKYPSYLSTGLEEYFRTDSHFQKQSANQKLLQLVLDSQTLINRGNQSHEQIEEIQKKLSSYLCERHKIEVNCSQTVQLIVSHYVHARVGMLSSVIKSTI